MKKLVFSFLIIGTFAAYALFAQMSGRPDTRTPIIVNEPSGATVGQTPPATTTSAPPTPPTTPTTPTTKTTATKPKGQYRDGTYTGSSVDAYYGNVQVAAIIQGGKISDVRFLDYPQDRGRSVAINTYAMPLLTQEAIQAQNANVDIVTGATATSGAFQQSLASALAQAKN